MTPFPIFIAHATGENGKNTHRLGIFKEHQTAMITTLGQGSFGGNGAVEKAHAITVDGKSYLLKQVEPISIDDSKTSVFEEARNRALAKLSPEDLRVLGLHTKA